MSNYSSLKTGIQNVIKQNGNNEITGTVLQQALISMVNSLAAGYIYKGIANTSTSPESPDQNIFYVAGAGNYSNFGSTTHIVPDGYLGFFKYNGSWTLETVQVGDANAVKYIVQTLTDAQKTQARTNIGAVSSAELAQVAADIGIETVENQNNDLAISDNRGNDLVHFLQGHIKTKRFDSRNAITAEIFNQIIPIITEALENYDFDISDENRNTIVRFMNGHIKTKNFDSTPLFTLAPFYNKFIGKNLGIIGDSISTYSGWLPSDVSGYSGNTYATYYPRGDVNSVERTWWHQVYKKLGFANVCNCSWSGSRVTGDSDSTTRAYAGCSTRRISDLTIRGHVPDVIIIFLGRNDWGNNVSLGTWTESDGIPSGGTISLFRTGYALMLAKIRQTYKRAKIYCCTNLDDIVTDTGGWPTNNASGISTVSWNKNVMEIAEYFGCSIVDLHNCGINYFNLDLFSVDAQLHPNAAGMELMAEKIICQMLSK